MKHSKSSLKIGEKYKIDNYIVGTFMGKTPNQDLVFSVNTGSQNRTHFIKPENQQEYYKVARFGKIFRFALLILSLLPIWGYMEIDFREMIPLWQYLGFIALICYMAVVLIVVLNSNLIKE